MNIFVTSKCPIQSANWLDDVRANKMFLESCQMLSTWMHELHPDVYCSKRYYKTTHLNHPCNVWIRESKSNIKWLFDHTRQLSRRLKPEHKCNRILHNFMEDAPLLVCSQEPKDFMNCTTFKEVPVVTDAYKLFMNEKWKNDKIKLSWNQPNAIIPDWKTL